MFKQTVRTLPVIAALALAACGDSTGPGQEQEIISRVSLTLTPVGGGTAQVIYIDDADGLGPNAPSAQVGTLQLTQGTSYTGTVRFENRLVSPVENITEEVVTEADEHMVIYTVGGGAGVTVTTSDIDGSGRQLGVNFTAATAAGAAVGARTMRVVLCHYDATPKPTTATACSGDTDIDVSFNFGVIASLAAR
jgi:predicted ThiF/HesA family dinucleotide-utilizing enzyme